jgi:hypothetical protein
MKNLIASVLFVIVSVFGFSQTKIDSSYIKTKPNESYIVISLTIDDLVLHKKNKSKTVLNHFDYFCFSLQEPLNHSMYSKKFNSSKSKKLENKEFFFKDDVLTFIVTEKNKKTFYINLSNDKYGNLSVKINQVNSNGKTKTYYSNICKITRKSVL